MFDKVTEEERADDNKWPIDYITIKGSLWHVLNMCFGNTNWDFYELGEASQSTLLYTLHIVTGFIIMIHLLNMLIAIMGNTFSERQANIDKIYYRDHLAFVLDNWYLLTRAFGSADKLRDVKYIFAALAPPEDDADQELLNELHAKVTHQQEELQEFEKKTLKATD